MKTNLVTQLAAGLVVLAVVLAALAAHAAAPAKISIAINDKCIAYGPANPAGNQQYQVTVKNFASSPRGFKLSGKDRAGSDFVRYTDILQKGQTQTFSFYFPSRTTVNVREMLTCEKGEGSCVKATYGKHKIAIRFR